MWCDDLALLAALAWLLHGCAASSLQSQSSDSSVGAIRAYDDRFGRLSCGKWIGSWPAPDGQIPFTVDWCRAEYSDYDIMQSKGFFQGRAAIIARLACSNPGPHSRLDPLLFSGKAEGNVITLWQIPLPALSDIGDESANAVCDYIQRLNTRLRETTEPWRTSRLTVRDTGERIEMNVLAGSRLPTSSTQLALRRVDVPSIAHDAWVGAAHYQNRTLGADCFERLFVSWVTPDGSSHPSALPPSEAVRTWDRIGFGFFSCSNRDRRLEGDVPANSVWQSRQQFVRFIQQTWEMGIETLEDPLPPEVQALLQREIGEVRSAARLKEDAEEIFGSWDAMMTATCPFAEAFHFPVFAVVRSNHAVVLSLQWFQSKEPPSRVHALRMQIIPDVSANVFHNSLVFTRFPEQGADVISEEAIVSSWFKLPAVPK